MTIEEMLIWCINHNTTLTISPISEVHPNIKFKMELVKYSRIYTVIKYVSSLSFFCLSDAILGEVLLVMIDEIKEELKKPVSPLPLP